MNPLTKYSIENFKELIEELGRINKPEYLFDLEDRIIDEYNGPQKLDHLLR